uniref:Ribosomal protein 63, mitochondrial n=3 Tax=Lygus hesperus TaxID=30085 RepID=A0A146L8R5_LYGHE
MRLTWALFLYKRPKGHLFRGKYRFVKRVSKDAMDTLKYEFQQEEQNMFYLRHPYLNQEETKCLKEIEKVPFWGVEKWNERNSIFEKRRTLADELSHLKVTQDWDFKGGYKF